MVLDTIIRNEPENPEFWHFALPKHSAKGMSLLFLHCVGLVVICVDNSFLMEGRFESRQYESAHLTHEECFSMIITSF